MIKCKYTSKTINILLIKSTVKSALRIINNVYTCITICPLLKKNLKGGKIF